MAKYSQGGKEIEEALKLKSEGIVPLQSGTNRLASQVCAHGLQNSVYSFREE